MKYLEGIFFAAMTMSAICLALASLFAALQGLK